VWRLSVVFAMQGWLSESPEATKAASTPALLTVGMSCRFSACTKLEMIAYVRICIV
jgi:hypothetical protein